MISQDVTIHVDGAPMSAYLTRPEEQSGPHPAVIVLQEIFGFTPEVRRVTELLPAIGYAGLAIDTYHRTHPKLNAAYTDEGYRQALDAAGGVNTQNLTRDIEAAAAWLNGQSFVKRGKIATWGMGFGATAAFIAATLPEICGSVSFYPTHLSTALPSGAETPLDRASGLRAPLLLIFGEQDYYVSRHEMERVRTALAGANKELQMQIYPGVGHSFFRHGRPEAIAEQNRYSDEAIAQAVADSWDLVKVFLGDVFNRQQRPAVESGDIRTARKEPVR